MRKPLSEKEIESQLHKLSGWQHVEDALVKVFRFRHYLDGVAFANQVAALSEEKDHHPELTISWRSVRVSFTTHDAGNRVTQRDFTLAHGVETLTDNELD